MPAGSIQGTAPTLGLYAHQAPKPGSPPGYDPKDANRDGLVSFAEAKAYSLNHPEIEAMKRLRTGTRANSMADRPGPRLAGMNTLATYGPTGAPARGDTKTRLDLLA